MYRAVPCNARGLFFHPNDERKLCGPTAVVHLGVCYCIPGTWYLVGTSEYVLREWTLLVVNCDRNNYTWSPVHIHSAVAAVVMTGTLFCQVVASSDRYEVVGGRYLALCITLSAWSYSNI